METKQKRNIILSTRISVRLLFLLFFSNGKIKSNKNLIFQLLKENGEYIISAQKWSNLRISFFLFFFLQIPEINEKIFLEIKKKMETFLN